MYVFHKSYVRMTIPSRFSCSPRSMSSLSAAACAIWKTRSLSSGLLRHRRLIVHFHLGLVAQRTDHLVAAGYDLVALLETAQDFDVGRAGNAGLHLAEYGFAAGHHEHTLHLFLASLFRGRIRLGRCQGAAAGLGFFLQVALLPDSERLNRNGQRLLARCRGDLGRTGQPRPYIVRRIVHGDYYLEIFG